MTDRSHEAQNAWFLGPRAENADLMERLVVEALRDHAFWRRGFHPEDRALIPERARRAPGYLDAAERLTQELIHLLARLKADLPFFSGRYLGHMVNEQTLASQVGYIAAMLYNPNNVVAETSPVTTRLELEVAADLARMVGYAPERAWGHLTSGGTLANFEALWIARSTFYLPLAIAGAAKELGTRIEVRLPTGDAAPLEGLGLWELLNLAPSAALDLRDAFLTAVDPGDARRALEAHSLAAIGYQDYTQKLARTYGDPLPAATVLVAASAHYSWEKIVRALGIGARRLVTVPIDPACRMDPDALWATLRDHADRRVPVLGLVSVCGTTEESAVDRLDRIVEVRERAARELGLTFHLHSDACYGGYAAAVTWGRDGRRRTAEEIHRTTASAWPEAGWVEAMTALGETDSVSIDPHKLGYVPYAAGAFLLKDRRARELVALDPPYLIPTAGASATEERFLGRYSLEGSRPGASAAAVWLGHKVVPLNEEGYGHLIERTVVGARRLHAAIATADLAGARAVMLPRPDINIVNFAIHAPGLADLASINAFNEALYERLSQAPGRPTPEYYVTRTRLTAPTYDGAIGPLLKELPGVTREAWAMPGAGLVVLRMTVMDPWLAEGTTPDHIAGFVRHLGTLCAEIRGAMGDHP